MHRLKPLVAAAALAVALIAAPVAAAPGKTTRPALFTLSVSYVQVPVEEVARRLSKDAGLIVVADRTLAGALVTLDMGEDETLPLPALLERIAAVLPRGAAVKTVYLPAPAPGAAPPTADKIAAFVAAQEALAGPAAKGKTTVLLQGRRVPADKAAPILAALDLKPAYLLTNPSAAR